MCVVCGCGGGCGVGQATALAVAEDPQSLSCQHSPPQCHDQPSVSPSVSHLLCCLCEQVLLGSYVCTEAVGEFKWQPGVITQAVSQGRWLLLEDVDRAPMEVMAALASLIEGRTLYLPGRATTLQAPSTFRLWATVTTQPRTSTHAVEGRVFRAALWQHLVVPAPSAQDLQLMVATKYPSLAQAADEMVRTVLLLLDATGFRPAEQRGSGAAAPPTTDGEAADASTEASAEALAASAAEAQLESARCALGAGRAYSSRDLLKWAARVDVALRSAGAGSLPPPSSHHFTAQLRELVLLEALDAFVWAVRREGPRKQLASLLAHAWQVALPASPCRTRPASRTLLGL